MNSIIDHRECIVQHGTPIQTSANQLSLVEKATKTWLRLLQLESNHVESSDLVERELLKWLRDHLSHDPRPQLRQVGDVQSVNTAWANCLGGTFFFIARGIVLERWNLDSAGWSYSSNSEKYWTKFPKNLRDYKGKGIENDKAYKLDHSLSLIDVGGIVPSAVELRTQTGT